MNDPGAPMITKPESPTSVSTAEFEHMIAMCAVVGLASPYLQEEIPDFWPMEMFVYFQWD